MSHGSTEHNLEEAHHAHEARLDNFTRNVAMTMAIIAAGLAFVTLLSHRQHNETLALQIKSNDNLTLAANKWAYYQAKKNRQYMKDGFADMLDVSAPAPGKEAKAAALIEKGHADTKRYETESKQLEDEARALENEAKKFEHEAHESHFIANFFDLGHLGIELGLVVCSLAVLTRKSLFWYGGIGVAVLGLVVALSGFAAPSLPALWSQSVPAHAPDRAPEPSGEPAGHP